MNNNFKWWDLLDKNNLYFRFIQKCKLLANKDKESGVKMQLHHIIPKHMLKKTPEGREFCESQENLIYLSLDNHIRAHKILYKLYRKKADKGAVLMLQGNKAASRRLWRQSGAAATHNLLKNKKRTFWDSAFQKEMARRSIEKPDALEVRSKGGRKGGHQRNVGRAIKPNHRYLFYFYTTPVLCIFNCETGGDVLVELNKFKKTNLLRQ